MDHVLLAAPWLMAFAAVVSAAACLAAGRSVPWQGRQAALIMAGAMLVLPAVHGDAVVGLAVGIVLLASAMLGTAGVRGAPSATACCHRALVSLVMAMCAFEGLATGEAPVGVAGHGGHGLTGVLSGLMVVGAIAVVLWTVVEELVLASARRSTHRGRAARMLALESWAMAVGVTVMCVGF